MRRTEILPIQSSKQELLVDQERLNRLFVRRQFQARMACSIYSKSLHFQRYIGLLLMVKSARRHEKYNRITNTTVGKGHYFLYELIMYYEICYQNSYFLPFSSRRMHVLKSFYSCATNHSLYYVARNITFLIFPHSSLLLADFMWFCSIQVLIFSSSPFPNFHSRS